jgi:riboflavin kinase/FMN adenylyltransferase
VVIGFNHHFGHNREGNYDYLYELGQYYKFDVEEIPEQDIHKETVSSTLIRKAISEGKIQRANAYLDHHYMIIGKLENGSLSCESLDFPTYRIKIEEDSKLVPSQGVYAVSVLVDKEYFKGILNIKYQNSESTEDKTSTIIDVHVHDCPQGFENKNATVLFAKRLRDEVSFSSKEQMLRQLKSDLVEVEDLIY